LPTAEEAAGAAEFRVALEGFLHRTERVAREVGITPRWYLVLLLIKGAPDLSERSTVTDLARRLGLAQSTVTELVRRAERAGLLAREPSATDARVAHLRLTPEGERRLGQAFESLASERRALRDAIAGLDV
jgi:DNA-binding MarR family transcriptional regulator